GTATRPPTNLAEVTLTLYDPESEKAPEVPSSQPEAVPEAPVPDADTAAEDLASDESSRVTGHGPQVTAPETAVESPAAPMRRKKALNLNILPGEVVVTRRLYRDGTSEYYLNGELCRLRDIQELFMGTGLGPESYAIIEQGRVGQILSSRPSDRRALLEEAAGVSKYKTKRRLAEAKLESAHQNLLRVNDILEEITKQLNSLKRQAARARRYQELKSEGTHLHRQLLASQLDQLRVQSDALTQQGDENRVEFERTSATLAEREQQQGAAQQRQYELEAALRAEQNRAGQVLIEVERAHTRRAETRRLQEETAARLATLAAERVSLAQEFSVATAALGKARRAGEEQQQELGAAVREVERLTAETEALRQRISALETERRELEAAQAQAATWLLSARAELAQLEAAAETSSEPLRRLEAERELARSERERLAAEEGRRGAAVAQARGEQARASENVAAAEQELARTQQELESHRRRLHEAHEALAKAAANEKALAELVASRAALAEPVQKLLVGLPAGQAGAGGATASTEFRSVGVVADFTELEPDYAPLLEDYLHEELEFVVVETYDAARTGVSLLRDQMGGRATFLVDSFGRFPPAVAPEEGAPQGDGIVARVADLVRINGPLGSEAKRVLPRLARTWLVSSAPAAETLARQYPNYFFLSKDGSWYHGRLVSGGVRNGHGSHALEREHKRAEAQRREAEPSVATAEQELKRLEAGVREQQAALDSARQALFAQEKTLMQLEQQLAGAAAERARHEQLEARAAEEISRLTGNQGTAGGRLLSLRQKVATLDEQSAARSATLQSSAEELQRCRQELEAAAAQLADLRARQASLEARLIGSQQDVARLEADVARLTTEQQEQAALEAQLTAEQQRLAEELIAREAELVEAQQAKTAQELRCQECETELAKLRQQLVDADAALRQLRSELDALRERRHALEVEQARLASDRQHLEITLQGEFGLTTEQLLAEVTERLSGDALAQVEVRFREIKQRLETIGPVNMMALEEFQECEQRFNFLTAQRDDLMASIADTTNTIREIDAESAKRFEEAFAVINRNFEETFKTLFGGGTATLRLSEGENPLDAGIDLICQPPGKRLQNVLLLSGGEKALTALALLIAIFRYSPSPFCILDEVDAPLDDTNVGRFTRLVQEMSAQTQFILVTHNKKT
ncbi:MAG: chromosome segregation protein SMC, partial [Candidatus Acidiferrales bacterium]